MNSVKIIALFFCIVYTAVISAQNPWTPADCEKRGVECPADGTCTITTHGSVTSVQCSWASGLSLGAAVGIAIGVIVVIAGFVTAICFCGRCGCFRYRRNASLVAQMSNGIVYTGHPTPYQQMSNSSIYDGQSTQYQHI